MRLKLTARSAISLRFRLAENLASQELRGILTTKYPPEILDTEFFEGMPNEEKLFLKKYWTTFDILKPVYEIIKEIPVYRDFIVYEVKSYISKETKQNKKPLVQLTVNQKKFFDECKEKGISTKIFYVRFLRIGKSTMK